jgi:hypothetical protein
MAIVKIGVSQSLLKLSAIGENAIVSVRSPISAPHGPAIWLLRVVPTILLCRDLDEKSHGQRRPHQTDTSGYSQSDLNLFDSCHVSDTSIDYTRRQIRTVPSWRLYGNE